MRLLGIPNSGTERVKSTYRESVSPVPAAESRRLAMVDGVSIVLDHAKRYDTPRALCGLQIQLGWLTV